jgi:nucleoside-diphosphate-sugar epimerase
MLNVLITGSTGFVGSHLKSYFKGIYNLTLPSRYELTSDILFDGIDVVIHLAGKAHDTNDIGDFEDYHNSNTQLTNRLFDKFLISDTSVFIFMSSILVVSPSSKVSLTEEMTPNPLSPYARSKYESELYISNSNLPQGKRFYILRPPLVYGKGNKGNLILLYDFIKKIPFWPLGNYASSRSFCDIRNISFVIQEMIRNQKIDNGIYHIADNQVYDLSHLYTSISLLVGKKPRIIDFPTFIVQSICILGSILKFSFNLNRLRKLTSSLLVSNTKVKAALHSDLPYGSMDDLLQSLDK